MSAPEDTAVDPETWVREHGDALFRYALGRLRDRAAAEDAVQETFLGALKARERYRPGTSLRGWLMGILKHKVVDHLRRSARQVELAHQFINFLHDPDVAKENTEFIQYLCPNTGAYPLLSPDITGNPAIFLDPAIRAKSEMIDDVGEALPLYSRMWDEIKAAP